MKIEGVKITSDVPGGDKVTFDSTKDDKPTGQLFDLLQGPDRARRRVHGNNQRSEMQATDVDGREKAIRGAGW